MQVRSLAGEVRHLAGEVCFADMHGNLKVMFKWSAKKIFLEFKLENDVIVKYTLNPWWRCWWVIVNTIGKPSVQVTVFLGRFALQMLLMTVKLASYFKPSPCGISGVGGMAKCHGKKLIFV